MHGARCPILPILLRLYISGSHGHTLVESTWNLETKSTPTSCAQFTYSQLLRLDSSGESATGKVSEANINDGAFLAEITGVSLCKDMQAGPLDTYKFMNRPFGLTGSKIVFTMSLDLPL